MKLSVTVFLAAMKLLITCDIDEDRHYLCPETCWIMVRQLFLDWDESKFFWISFRSILVTGVSIAGPLSLESDHVLTLVIGVIVILVRIALLSKITGDNVICTIISLLKLLKSTFFSVIVNLH